MESEHENAAQFFRPAIAEIAGLSTPTQMKVMEFGCGSGELVHLLVLGYEAYGCDIESYRQKNAELIDRFEEILLMLYRLPRPILRRSMW